MRIVLLYPPPWKIPARGEPAELGADGPPADYRDGDLDADFHQTPYGLFSLGAQAMRAGHAVKIFNLSGFTWAETERVVAALDADLFGMSCWTANRRGVALVGRLIKRLHPRAHLVVGGPHATPLAKEMLEHHPEIDTIVTGEGDATFLELIERLEAGRPTTALAGTWYRGAGGAVERGPERPSIPDLDTLACPHDYFSTHIVMTSRGCPWQCTFCGAETTWGRGFRGQSVGYVLDSLEQALARLPVKMLQIKDDTFTTNKKRVLEICRGIRERGLSFFWSCDTRVDVLSDELLREMRLAGCQRLSLGVESGSPRILKEINKKITVDKILESTALAKKWGVQVRFYMMLGNRGETRETFHETLEFLQRARPHQYLFSCLSIYPGTVDFDDAEKDWLDREVYFTGDFQELKTPFDASPEDTALMSDWFARNKGLKDAYRPSAAECRDILARLGDHHAAHVDLAEALCREGRPELAGPHVRRALELGYPAPGLAHNTLAYIAAARGDLAEAEAELRLALRKDPQHWVVARNAERFHAFLRSGLAGTGARPDLVFGHDFQLFERTVQPTLPGPLPADFADWSSVTAGGVRPSARLPALAWKQDERVRLNVLTSP